ncbi:hypothetical protein ACFQ0O_34940 [Saccharopolyspora spinosporotrichia]
MPAGEVSEAVAAARRKFEEIRATAAARMEVSVQAANDADRKAAEAGRSFSEKVQKIEQRVRERIAEREAAANPKHGAEEIKIGVRTTTWTSRGTTSPTSSATSSTTIRSRSPLR